jgi:hypothetical protein
MVVLACVAVALLVLLYGVYRLERHRLAARLSRVPPRYRPETRAGWKALGGWPTRSARRERIKAIMADVRRGAPSMGRAELRELVMGLEALYGPAMRPLRTARVTRAYGRYEIGPPALIVACFASVGGCLIALVVADAAGSALGGALGALCLAGFLASVVALDRHSRPRQRALHEAVITDVRVRSREIDRDELEQLVDDLEAIHGRSPMRPLRELVA